MARSTPTHADLERAIESVPGVAEAHVTRVEETGRSRLRIRLANDEDAGPVSWSIAATLRERFGISLDPDQIRPRVAATPPSGTGSTLDTSDAVGGSRDDAEVVGIGASDEDAPDDLADGQDVLVAGDRVLLSEAARALLEEAVAEAREAERSGNTDIDTEVTADAPDTAEVTADVTPDAADARAEVTPDAAEVTADVTPDAADARAEVTPDAAELTADVSPDPAEVTADPADVTADPAAVTADAPDAAEVTADVTPDAADTAEVTADADAPEPASTAKVRALADASRDRDDGTRARIRHLDTRVDVSDVEVTATLCFAGREVIGSARAVATEQGILRAVAEATLHALSELTGERLVAGVDSVAASVSGEPPIATVIVSLVTDRGNEALLGSSLVRKDPQRAVMRATLDALNRRVEPWLEVEIAG